jgi:hypothetical protein
MEKQQDEWIDQSHTVRNIDLGNTGYHRHYVP